MLIYDSLYFRSTDIQEKKKLVYEPKIDVKYGESSFIPAKTILPICTPVYNTGRTIPGLNLSKKNAKSPEVKIQKTSRKLRKMNPEEIAKIKNLRATAFLSYSTPKALRSAKPTAKKPVKTKVSVKQTKRPLKEEQTPERQVKTAKRPKLFRVPKKPKGMGELPAPCKPDPPRPQAGEGTADKSAEVKKSHKPRGMKLIYERPLGAPDKPTRSNVICDTSCQRGRCVKRGLCQQQQSPSCCRTTPADTWRSRKRKADIRRHIQGRKVTKEEKMQRSQRQGRHNAARARRETNKKQTKSYYHVTERRDPPVPTADLVVTQILQNLLTSIGCVEKQPGPPTPIQPPTYANVVRGQQPAVTPSLPPRPVPRQARSNATPLGPPASTSNSAPDPAQMLLRTERSQLELPLAQQLLCLRNRSKTECYSHGGTNVLISNPCIVNMICNLNIPHPLVRTLQRLCLLPPNTVTDLIHLRSAVADIVPTAVVFNETRQQQDAHEWIVSLLYAVEVVLRDVGDPRDVRTLKSLLEMKITKTRECSDCGLQGEPRTEIEEVLSLPIVDNEPLVSLSQCFDNYLSVRRVSYSCSCGSHNSNLYYNVDYYPPVLLLHFKRFGNDEQKISHNVSFAFNMQVMPNSPTYVLTGILLHIGRTVSSGHYMCAVRCCKTGDYYLTSDDAIPKRLEDSELLPLFQNAYMLVYSRSEHLVAYTIPLMQQTAQTSGIDQPNSAPKRPQNFTPRQQSKLQKSVPQTMTPAQPMDTGEVSGVGQEVCGLPLKEMNEYEILKSIPRKKRSPQEQERFAVLQKEQKNLQNKKSMRLKNVSNNDKEKEKVRLKKAEEYEKRRGKQIQSQYNEVTGQDQSNSRPDQCPGCAAQMQGHECSEGVLLPGQGAEEASPQRQDHPDQGQRRGGRGQRKRGRGQSTRGQQRGRGGNQHQPDNDQQETLEDISDLPGGQDSAQQRKSKRGSKTKATRNFPDDFHANDQEEIEMMAAVQSREIYLKEKLNRLQNDDFSWDELPPNPLHDGILKMEEKLGELEYVYCRHCDEMLYNVKLTSRDGRCDKCVSEWKNSKPGQVLMWSPENDMRCSQVPPELQNLTPVEQSAIQRLFPVMKIYRVSQGALYLKGHCLSVLQDLEGFVKRLPPVPSSLPMIFLIGPGQRIPLRANRNKIHAALECLKKTCPYFADLDIDFEALDAYPNNDDDFVEGLNTIIVDADEDEREAATAYTEDEGHAGTTHSAIPTQVAAATVREEIRRQVLGEPPIEEVEPLVEWPDRSRKPVNENIPGFFSMSFPWLPGFCHGLCDITVPGRPAGNPQYLAWLSHLLHHPSRAFGQDPRFQLYAVNRHRRNKALTQGNVFVKYSEKDVTVETLKQKVEAGDYSIFNKLLYFTRSTTGSRQFFKYEGKKARSFVNYVHYKSEMQETFNVFLTLSFPDLHDPNLHRLLPNSEKYLGKTVVSSLASLPPGSNPGEFIDAATDNRLRAEAVAANSDICCHYLNSKLWLFFKHVLIPLGVIDYILRVEFQYRSSEHFHMVLRVMHGVSLDTVHNAFRRSKFEIITMKEEDLFNQLPVEKQFEAAEDHETVVTARHLVQEFSSLRLGQTAVHPQPDHRQWPPPEGPNRERPSVNCLRQLFSEVVQSPQLLCQDCRLLTDRVQRHKCNKKYCLKSIPSAPLVTYCKFKFPQDLEGFEGEFQGDFITHITNKMGELGHDGARFSYEVLHLARNHPRIVDHIQELLQGWRGNINVQVVKSLQQLLQYVVKYMLKATTGSASFRSTIRDITMQQSTDSKAASIFQKVLLRQITEHDMPKTEATRIVLNLPFVFYSRDFKMVNLLGVRRLVGLDRQQEGDPDRRATRDNIADLYWAREGREDFQHLVEEYEAGTISLPQHPRDINLFNYTAHFEKSWRPAVKSSIPHISPTFSYVPDPHNEHNKEIRKSYLTTQLLVFHPGMTPLTLPENLETAMAKFVHSEHCPRLVREEYLESMKREKPPTEEVEPLLASPRERDPSEIQQDPYMAGLGARLTTVDLNNLNHIEEEEEMREGDSTVADYAHLTTDDTVDWSRDRVLLGLTAAQIKEAEQWLERVKVNTILPAETWEQEYSPADLNEKQRQVYDRVLGLVETGKCEGHLIDLSGGAGTGKTRLIRTILQNIERVTGKSDTARVCAYTNSAAGHFVGGSTLHRLLRLDVSRNQKYKNGFQAELEGLRLASLQEDFKNTKVLIIDEKSMVGCFLLWCIDQRLRQARPSHALLPFGGHLVLMCGDLSQLPPVGDLALYATSGRKTAKQLLGFGLYKQFVESYTLVTSMRQIGEENEHFRQELGRLAHGTFTIQDWRRWSTRELKYLPEEEKVRFETEGIKLCSRKTDMVSYNEAGLIRTNNPILVMRAVHNNTTAARASAGQLPTILPVARGASVVLTSNLWPQAKLLNGSRGTVTYIVFGEGKGPGDGLPDLLVVTFPKYTGPPYIPGEPGTVPVVVQLADWKEGKTRCLRTIFPLILGFSITIHKSQGQTIEQPLVLDVGPKEFELGLSYTGSSRTTTFTNLAFDPLPSFNRILKIFALARFKEKEAEVKRRSLETNQREEEMEEEREAQEEDMVSSQLSQLSM